MLKKGCVVRSIAGHDKDSFYVLTQVSADRVFIADGKRRRLAAPKGKNPLHVRPTAIVLDMEAITTDKKLREALRPFNGPLPEQSPEERGR